MMQRGLILCVMCLILGAVHCFGSASDALERAVGLREQGEFKKASALLSDLLKGNLSSVQRQNVLFQIDLLQRIRQDYAVTEQELLQQLANSVKEFSAAEFKDWVKQGRFDCRSIDGELRFFNSSISNLYFRYPDINARRITPNPKHSPEAQRAMLAKVREIKQAAAEKKTPYVLPYRYKCTMTVETKPNVVPAGETIRAWLPIPRAYPFQTGIKIFGSSPEIKVLAPEKSSIRSAYFEQVAQKDASAKFQVTYEYSINGVRFALKPEEVCAIDATDRNLKPYLAEVPHVVFTPTIKKLANEIADQQKNPMLKAKAFFDWIAENISYSYAREYSTLTNISDYCYTHRYGDCGQEALLFITLCRASGIPARWQSGWHLVPKSITNHDWTEIYLAPYGWIPCDPWAGIHAMHYCTALAPEERREIRDFYFGGNDQYRMIANCDHNQQFEPPKKTMRSDDVDFQRGELEYGDTNLYFDKFKYKLEVEVLSSSSQ